jgi:hypothetical protein
VTINFVRRKKKTICHEAIISITSRGACRRRARQLKPTRFRNGGGTNTDAEEEDGQMWNAPNSVMVFPQLCDPLGKDRENETQHWLLKW